MLIADLSILPQARSTFAEPVDDLFWFIHVLSLFFFVGILGAVVYFVLRWRKGHGEGAGPSHNLPLELTWSVIPLILVMSIFLWGFKTFMFQSTSPRDAIVVKVTGQKWRWSFVYPNGGTGDDLHVPVNKPVKLVMNSVDVLHSFFIPEFRQKMDVIPGSYTTLWFEATATGTYQVFCTEYCGDGHSEMLAKVIVHDEKGYQDYLEKIVADVKPTVELGAQLYQSKACFTCHSTDGSPKVGPTFKGLYGKQEELVDGTKVPVDDAYLRESILNPAVKVVKGFPPAMPPYQGQLKEGEIQALLLFIQAQK